MLAPALYSAGHREGWPSRFAGRARCLPPPARPVGLRAPPGAALCPYLLMDVRPGKSGSLPGSTRLPGARRPRAMATVQRPLPRFSLVQRQRPHASGRSVAAEQAAATLVCLLTTFVPKATARIFTVCHAPAPARALIAPSSPVEWSCCFLDGSFLQQLPGNRACGLTRRDRRHDSDVCFGAPVARAVPADSARESGTRLR